MMALCFVLSSSGGGDKAQGDGPGGSSGKTNELDTVVNSSASSGGVGILKNLGVWRVNHVPRGGDDAHSSGSGKVEKDRSKTCTRSPVHSDRGPAQEGHADCWTSNGGDQYRTSSPLSAEARRGLMHTTSPTVKERSKRFKEEVDGRPSQVWGGTRKEDAWTNCCRCCQSKCWRTQWTQQETSRQSSDSGLESSSKFGYPSFLRDFLWVWTSGKQCGSLYWLVLWDISLRGWIWPSFA